MCTQKWLHCTVFMSMALEFFTNSPQYKNANIANFVLVMPLDINYASEVYDIEF